MSSLPVHYLPQLISTYHEPLSINHAAANTHQGDGDHLPVVLLVALPVRLDDSTQSLKVVVDGPDEPRPNGRRGRPVARPESI